MRLLVAFCVLAVALAASRHVFFDRWNVPTDYVRGGFAPADAKVGFIIALRQRNLEALEELFWATSDPKASTYQQYRTIAEIQELVAPDQHAVTPVMEWLKEHGVQSVINHADALEVVCDVKTAEKLFETRFYSFLHVPTGKQYVRAWGTMSHPAEFTSIIEMIVGVSSFPIPKYKAKVYAPNDDQGIVPQTIWQLYQVPAQTAGGAATTSVGVIEFEQQFFTPSDLTSFGQNVNVPVQSVAASHIVGPNDPTSPQIESTLDIQMVAGVNDATTPWFWIEGDPSTWLYGFCTHFFTTKDVPQVVSISYGWSEADQCDIDPTVCQQLGVSGAGYAARVNTEFQKIALRGISVLVASGDSGANGRTDPDCSLPYLKPDFPAASPYVTSVGATQLNNPQFNLNNAPPVCNGQGYQCPSGGDEVAVSYDEASFASGGGFSNVAAQPAFQKAAVAGYFSSGVILPPSTYYNATGRGYPDISAMGNAVLIFQGGIQPVGGTSASAPIWAAIVGVANQASLKKTGKPLGYLNQWLYTMAAECPNCFHDITVGDNICTEDGCSPSCQGYKATKGWDPVTGLGSPNTANIIAYINK